MDSPHTAYSESHSAVCAFGLNRSLESQQRRCAKHRNQYADNDVSDRGKFTRPGNKNVEVRSKECHKHHQGPNLDCPQVLRDDHFDQLYLTVRIRKRGNDVDGQEYPRIYSVTTEGWPSYEGPRNRKRENADDPDPAKSAYFCLLFSHQPCFSVEAAS